MKDFKLSPIFTEAEQEQITSLSKTTPFTEQEITISYHKLKNINLVQRAAEMAVCYGTSLYQTTEDILKTMHEIEKPEKS